MEHTLTFIERSLHSAHFECNLDVSGFILVNMPIVDWKEMGCPKEMIFSLTPVVPGERTEQVVAA